MIDEAFKYYRHEEPIPHVAKKKLMLILSRTLVSMGYFNVFSNTFSKIGSPSVNLDEIGTYEDALRQFYKIGKIAREWEYELKESEKK